MAGQEDVVLGRRPAVGAPPPTSLAPGFRFHPTDEELVRYYLRRKACGKPFRFQSVTELDVYKSEPWELAGFSLLETRDLEWYFFSPVDKKYGNGSRLNRATVTGYWKATGKDRPVRHKAQTIGMKKTLVFHSGRAPDGQRTNWVMHEYRLCDSELESAGVIQDAFVLCRIFQKSGLGPPNGDRYAPFVDEEWDDKAAHADDGVVSGEDARSGYMDFDEEDTPLTIGLPQVESPADLPFMGKRESPELRLSQSKRLKPGDSNRNGSEDSITTQDPPQTKIMATNFSSSLLDLPKENNNNNNNNNNNSSLALDSSNLEKSVPPGYLKFISNLESEILNVSMERETLKIELMRAQAMINVLQSRIDVLAQENDDLIMRSSANARTG